MVFEGCFMIDILSAGTLSSSNEEMKWHWGKERTYSVGNKINLSYHVVRSLPSADVK